CYFKVTLVHVFFVFTFPEHSIFMNKKTTPSGVVFKYIPSQSIPSFCTKFGLMFNSVVGMGKMRRVGSLLVLKVQEYSHLPKRIRSFLLQPSRATPVCVSTDCLPERR